MANVNPNFVSFCKKHNVVRKLNIWGKVKKRYYICNECHTEANIKYTKRKIKQDKYAYKLKIFNIYLKKKGHKTFTLDEIKKYLKPKNNRCEICNIKVKFNEARIDHCHKTYEIRGILCHYCNVGIGNFKDKVSFLYKAINYLNKAKVL